MTRKLTWATTIFLTLALAGAAWANHSRFTDVTDNHPVDAIEWAADQRITLGCGDAADNTFCPDQPLKRAHARVFIERFYDQVLGADGDDQYANADFTRADMMALLHNMAVPTATRLPVTTTRAPTTTTTARPTTTTVATCSDTVCLIDHYWFSSGRQDDIDNYAVKFRVNQACQFLYVEVHLLDDNGRRFGEWDNKSLFSTSIGQEFTIEVNYINKWDMFDRFEWEATCH